MHHRHLIAAAVAALTAVVALTAPAHDYRAGDIRIDHPWSRATAPTAQTGAGFLVMANEGQEDDRLLSATADVAEKVELHRTEAVDGVMRMRPQTDGIPVPAGESVTLEPGGFHIMLIGLKEPLVEGSSVPITLTFERAGEVAVDLTVESIGARSAGTDGGASHH
ncbi:MAG: copper chaperone PCu(A)C [Inquilinaceae bacterium]